MATQKYPLFLLSFLLIIMLTAAVGDCKLTSAERQLQTHNAAETPSETAGAASLGAAKDISQSAIEPPFDKAHINWRRFEGETIHVLLSGHPIQGTIIGRLSEFKQLTGITVVVDVLPEEDFFQKLNIDFESGKGAIDVFMTSPRCQWRYAQAGWIEDLRPYLDNPSLTDKKWFNAGDFFPVLWKASMRNGSIGGGLGQEALYSIPVWWEGCTLMYRKDLAEKYGFTEPKTWDGLYRQLSRIPKRSKGKLYGFIGRGIRNWSQIHTYHMTMMASQGGRDLDPYMLRRAIQYGNWMAPRRSVWFDPGVEAFLRTIDNGRWYENSTKLITRLAVVRWRPNPLAPVVGDLWTGAIQDAWRGKYTVKQAHKKTAAEVNVLMKKAGYRK